MGRCKALWRAWKGWQRLVIHQLYDGVVQKSTMEKGSGRPSRVIAILQHLPLFFPESRVGSEKLPLFISGLGTDPNDNAIGTLYSTDLFNFQAISKLMVDDMNVNLSHHTRSTYCEEAILFGIHI